jgi:hypothetical protein
VTASAPERYVEHAERFGVELVFETAVGLGGATADLTVAELVDLARRLRTIDPGFDPGKLDELVEKAGAGFVRVPDDFPSADPAKRYAYRRDQAKRRYLERIAPVLDALAVPAPTSAARCCELCGRALSGRADRRTCSGAHREALRRAGGVGPFSRPDVTLTGEGDLRVVPGRSVTPTAHEQRRFEAENRGGGDFREVSAAGRQLGPFMEARPA